MKLNDEQIKKAIQAFEHDVNVIEVKVTKCGGGIVEADVLGEAEGIKEWANGVLYDLNDLTLAYEQISPTVFAFDLSRVYKWFGDKAFGVISAYLSDKSPEENEANQDLLKKDVRDKGYGYKEMKGAWRPDENSSVTFEYALFVPLMTIADAVELGNKYNQYAVIYGDGQNVILDFLGHEPNKVFNKMETDYQNAWISWSEFKRKKYRFASVVWQLPLPPKPSCWMEAQSVQAFLDVKRAYDYWEKK